MEQRTETDETPDTEWTFADRVHKARRLLGMEQKEFGPLFGVTDKAVSRWEGGHGKPRDLLGFADTVERLAKEHGLRGLTAEWILTGAALPLWRQLSIVPDIGNGGQLDFGDAAQADGTPRYLLHIVPPAFV